MKKLESNELKSLDLVNENILKLKVLFPEAVIENLVDFDILRQLLGNPIDNNPATERYGMGWHGKSRSRQISLTPSMGTLLPCEEESVAWDSTSNVFIEGDNLEVLKLLQKAYVNKARVIFIDPPYNTGKEFIYPDNFQENIDTYLKYTGQIDDQGMKFSSNTETGGRKHTMWLNMMYPRLKLARNLLTSQGAMFITIDDNEQSNLRKVCDEVFGEENFVANIIWQKKYTRANDAKWFSDNHDHVLCYAKNKDEFTLNQLPRSEDQLGAYKNPDDHPKGRWKSTPLHAKSGTNISGYVFKNGVEWSPPPGTYRRFNDESMKAMDDGNEIWFGADGTKTPSRKSFLCDIKDGVTPTTLWTYDEVGHNHEANSELKSLDMAGMFDNPKPTRLLKRIIQLTQSAQKDDLIIDFFAGSSTTAHAVLAANAEDQGTRRYVCVQLPEEIEGSSIASASGFKNIASLSCERIRRAGNRLSDQVSDTGFRYFRLSSSNIKPWSPSTEDLEVSLLASQEHLAVGRTDQDILYELLLKRGVELSVPIDSRKVRNRTIYSVGFGVLFVCLEETIKKDDIEAVAQTIVDWYRELAPSSDTHVFFRDSAFSDDVSKTNMAAILEQNGIAHVRSL